MPYKPLPKPFHAWQHWLSRFDDNLQPIIADLLLQFNLFIGSISESQCSKQLSSDSSDLQKRGKYEHLLTTEWLIAQEEPDEFIRRAANNEHLFLTPAYEKPKANGVIIAMFDCGLLQLGMPRVAHLILMILFDIRAHNLNSQFYWGILQSNSELMLFSGIEDLKLLLKNRTMNCLDTKHLDYWKDYLKQSELLYDECWIIGNNFSKVDFATHKISINRLIGKFTNLSVDMTNNKISNHFELKLPNEVICAKMLSGLFESGSNYAVINEQSYLPLNANLHLDISPNSNHVSVFNSENNKICFITINDILSQRQVCRVKNYSLKSHVLGLDIQGKHIVALYQENQKYYLWGSDIPKRELSEEININAINQLSYFLYLYGDHNPKLLYIDEHQSLYSVYWINYYGDILNSQHEIAKNVIVLFKLSEKQACYIYQDDQEQFCITGYALNHLSYYLNIKKINENLQYFISSENLWLTGFGHLAVGFEHQWQVFVDENSYVEVTTPLEWQVFGFFYDNHEEKINFLIIDKDKKQVALFDYLSHKIDVCFKSSYKIVLYHYNSLAQSFSVIMDNGELILYSLKTQSIRLKLHKAD